MGPWIWTWNDGDCGAGGCGVSLARHGRNWSFHNLPKAQGEGSVCILPSLQKSLPFYSSSFLDLWELTVPSEGLKIAMNYLEKGIVHIRTNFVTVFKFIYGLLQYLILSITLRSEYTFLVAVIIFILLPLMPRLSKSSLGSALSHFPYQLLSCDSHC